MDRGLCLMGWGSALAVGLLSGLVALLGAAYVAHLSAGWHRMSSFEGAAGYFVVAMAIIGFLVGLALGIAMTRIVAGTAHPGFLKALGLAQGVTVGLLLLIGVTSRLLADVPPTLDGETLLLAVEIRWPEGGAPTDAGNSSTWRVRLSSAANRTVRASREGPLWREDARVEAGRWIVPGAVELFTGRGARVLDVVPEGVIAGGFIVPLPSRPNRSHLAWSDWLPHVPPGFHYRFRVVPVSQAIRTEAFGPFEIATIASGFGETTTGSQPPVWTADARFEIRHRGHPLVIEHPGTGAEGDSAGRFDRADAVAAVGGPVPALLVQVGAPRGEGPCFLVMEDGDSVATRFVGVCGDGLRLPPLTSDPSHFARALNWHPPAGRFDRTTFAIPGQYLLRHAVVDTRQYRVRPIQSDDNGSLIGRIPPLSVSPDGHSFVRIGFNGAGDGHLLVVDRLDTGERYEVPVDPVETRLGDIDMLDPAWVAAYYTWERGPDGVERLRVRTHPTPLPYRGRLSMQGSMREYRLSPAREGLRPALIEFLVTEFGAQRVHEDTPLAPAVRIDGQAVHVGYQPEDAYVAVWMDHGADPALLGTIAERFDAALRTGRYDAHFGR